MDPKVLNEHLDRRPFVPFQIVETGGISYEIQNPKMVKVTRRAVELAFPWENGGQRFVTIALVHVMHVEILLRIFAG